MKQKWLLCFIAFSCSALLADQDSEEESCGQSARPMRVSLRHIESGGIGYTQGYTTVEGFFAPDTNRFTYMPFLDLRLHVFDSGRIASNAGIGVRTLWNDRAYGANLYYDYRDTRRFHYNQVAFGLETLGTLWDIRANGYFPVGKTKSHPDHPKFHEFSSHHLILSRKYEFAMMGADAEIGFHFAKHNDYDFYAAAGPYYFKGDLGDAAWGGKGRVSGKYREYFVLELSNSYDNVFHNNFQAQVTLSYPFGPRSAVKKKKGSSHDCHFYETMSDRMVQPVGRDEIIVLDTHKKKSRAIDPATGLPFTFWFVDNRSHSQGTAESPFSSLVDAQNISGVNDIIYVYAGDQSAANMNSGFVMKDGQRLLGSGAAHYVQTTHGRVTIPQMTTTLPVISNSAGAVVTIVSNNEISGFYIQNLAGHGISQPNAAIEVSNLVVTNNVIQGNVGNNGIDGFNINGMLLYNNDFSSQNGAVNVLNTGTQNGRFLVVNNRVRDNGMVFSLTDSSNLLFEFSGNSFSTQSSPIDFTITNATFAAPHTISINNNIISSDSTNLFFNMFNHAQASVSIFNNTGFTPNGNNVTFNESQNVIANLAIEGNSFSCWDTGISIAMADSAQLNASLQNNVLGSDDSGNMNITVQDSSRFIGAIANNSMTTWSDVINLNIFSAGAAVSIFNIEGNTISGSGNVGILLQAQNSADMTASVVNNNISFIHTFGLSMATANTAVLKSHVINNQFNACSMGAVFVNQGGASTCLRFLDNTATPVQASPGGPGAFQFTQTAGTFNLEPPVGNVGYITETGTITPVPAGTCD